MWYRHLLFIIYNGIIWGSTGSGMIRWTFFVWISRLQKTICREHWNLVFKHFLILDNIEKYASYWVKTRFNRSFWGNKMAVLAKINLWKCQVYKIHDFCSGKFNFDGITSISTNKRFTLGVHAESWVPRGQCTPAGFDTQQEFILEHSVGWLCKLAHVRRSTVDSRKKQVTY